MSLSRKVVLYHLLILRYVEHVSFPDLKYTHEVRAAPAKQDTEGQEGQPGGLEGFCCILHLLYYVLFVYSRLIRSPSLIHRRAESRVPLGQRVDCFNSDAWSILALQVRWVHKNYPCTTED